VIEEEELQYFMLL